MEASVKMVKGIVERFESDLGALDKQMQDALDAAAERHRQYMKRLLKEPHDAKWPPKDPERRPSG